MIMTGKGEPDVALFKGLLLSWIFLEWLRKPWKAVF
jgi:hypothetical protein